MADGGRGFRLPGQDAVNLSRRKSLRLILARLADERARAPGKGLSVDDILAAGWPGERVIPEAGANRVYVALATLRKIGLRAVLLSREDGYMLDPDLRLERVAEM